ncbi:MAG: hypothetical protein C0196_02625 [Dictyoglomus turgidum]|nr:MAG: hypothetical protein C0196_02625 [Dictyoglomus turgidum]
MLKTKIRDENILNTIDMMESALQRGINLSNQILSFVRSEVSKVGIIQVKHIIREIERFLMETFPKDIEIKVEISKDLYPIMGDATKIHQVLMNLCVNARDAMPNGGVLSISAENIYLNEEYARWNPFAKQGPYVLITVSDTGVGIPKEIIDKIFDPFLLQKRKELGLVFL